MALHCMLNLRSDNEAGTHPAYLDAIAAAARGPAPAYGADRWTLALDDAFGALFGVPARVVPLSSGTAANALAVAHCCDPYGAVLCHEEAHLAVDECGAPEFYSGGTKLLTVAGDHAKLSVDALERRLKPLGAKGEHDPVPQLLSLTQATERGCIYSLPELVEIRQFCDAHGLRLHIDGARLANALVGLNVEARDFIAAARPDLISLGLTKNGALCAEALIVFDPALYRGLGHRRMKSGHLLSKLRMVSAQLLAGLEDDLWLQTAAQANAMATRLATLLEQLPGATLADPVQANEVFARLDAHAHQRLSQAGVSYHAWPGEEGLYRLVASWDTDAQLIEELERTLQ